jgi:hypothetical protein
MAASLGNINQTRVVPNGNRNDMSPVGKAGTSSTAAQVSNPKQLLASLLVEDQLEEQLARVRVPRQLQPFPIPSFSNGDDGSEDWMPMIRPQQSFLGTQGEAEGRGGKVVGGYSEADFLPPGWRDRMATTEERTHAEDVALEVGWKFDSLHRQEQTFRTNIEKSLSGSAKEDALKNLDEAVQHFSKQFSQELENAQKEELGGVMRKHWKLPAEESPIQGSVTGSTNPSGTRYALSDLLPHGWDQNRIVTMEERTEAEETEMRVGWKFGAMHKQEAILRNGIEQSLSGSAKDSALKELADAVAFYSKQFSQEVEDAKSGVNTAVVRLNPRNLVFIERMTVALNEHLGQ